MIYHTSFASPDRTDTFEVEADSLNDIKSFFHSVGVGTLVNVKKIHFSFTHDINFTKIESTLKPSLSKIKLFVLSSTKAKIIEIDNPVSTDKVTLLKTLKNFKIQGEKIKDIVSLVEFK